jgi:hypothetical protein
MNSSRKIENNENENIDVPSMFLRTPKDKDKTIRGGSIIDQYYANSGAKISVSPFFN